MKRFLIADDHEAVRSGLRAVLEQHPGWEVIAEVNDGSKAVAAAIAKQPDVAIVDLSMPRMTGFEVAQRIREYPLPTEVLIFTVHNSILLAQQAFQAGARAFLLKSDANKLLLTAIDSLLAHKPFCTDSCASELNGAWAGNRHRYHQLSPRERLVVKLVAEGYTNKRISAMLDLSVKTTEAHRAAAMRKLDVNSTAGLVRYAVRANLVEI
jgi:DNA-binding NarL/FixJ family response regulator